MNVTSTVQSATMVLVVYVTSTTNPLQPVIVATAQFKSGVTVSVTVVPSVAGWDVGVIVPPIPPTTLPETV